MGPADRLSGQARPVRGSIRLMTQDTPARRKVVASDVQRELLPGQSTALLRELHLLTRTGDLNADARRKLKQINHFCSILRPDLELRFDAHDLPVLLDAGAGNAYLGFVLYEVFLSHRDQGVLINIDRRADLIERGRERAQRLGYERMRFVEAALAPSGVADRAAAMTEPVHAVLSLHACDTATDDAIALGLQHRADLIAVVPCCQAEVHGLLKGQARSGPLTPLWRHNWHRREFAAHLTNVLRTLVLEAAGYKVRVTELAGWEHSLKNELIIATRHQRGNGLARRQLGDLLASLPPLPMKLLRTAQGDGADPATM